MVETPPLPRGQADLVVVTLPDEIDVVNADRVGADLNAAFELGVGVVIADMSGTRFCDTSGIYTLVMACKRAKGGNTAFRVVVPPGEVRQILEIMQLDTVLAVYLSLDVALSASDGGSE